MMIGHELLGIKLQVDIHPELNPRSVDRVNIGHTLVETRLTLPTAIDCNELVSLNTSEKDFAILLKSGCTDDIARMVVLTICRLPNSIKRRLGDLLGKSQKMR